MFPGASGELLMLVIVEAPGWAAHRRGSREYVPGHRWQRCLARRFLSMIAFHASDIVSPIT